MTDKHDCSGYFPEKCASSKSSTTSSPSSSNSTIENCILAQECRCKYTKKLKKRQPPPNIQHEFNMAKTILKECSNFSGDNMYDHLSELIRKILDQRPPNVIDYFEEFSRNIRDQKFHYSDSFMETVPEESRLYRTAESIMESLKLTNDREEIDDYEGEEDPDRTLFRAADLYENMRPISINENVIQLQLFWSLCGFGFNFDEVYQLSFAMMKLIQFPVVQNCRFWGKIYGLRKSYYIVEVDLIKPEKERRFEQMREEIHEKILNYHINMNKKSTYNSEILDPDLIPGSSWQNYPPDELRIMRPRAGPLPCPQIDEQFDTPPEPIGSGLNRKSYFVIRKLTDEWIELPIVTPKQIIISKEIKKYLTGDLEAEIISYPTFPGREKHLLRALIARISASTYIAPEGYCRKQSRREARYQDGDGLEDDEEELEEEEESEDEEDDDENKALLKAMRARDAVVVRNNRYKPLAAEELGTISKWVHTRPSILDQGRIMYFDKNKALQKSNGEEDEEEEEEEEEEESDRRNVIPEEAIGLELFAKCEDDTTPEILHMWSVRYSAKFNKMNRMVVLRSNLWPGSFTFAYENFCDTIYLGWGHKFIARNYMPPHIPQIQNEYEIGSEIKETNDPTVEMEEEWRLSRIKHDLNYDDEAEEIEEEDG